MSGGSQRSAVLLSLNGWLLPNRNRKLVTLLPRSDRARSSKHSHVSARSVETACSGVCLLRNRSVELTQRSPSSASCQPALPSQPAERKCVLPAPQLQLQVLAGCSQVSAALADHHPSLPSGRSGLSDEQQGSDNGTGTALPAGPQQHNRASC